MAALQKTIAQDRDEEIRPEILEIARMLARVAVNNYLNKISERPVIEEMESK